MDIQDAVLFMFSMIGVFGFMTVFQWLRPRVILWLRVLMELLWVFVVSSVAQMTGERFFGAPRGVDFSRVFLYSCLGIIIYILARQYQERLHRKTLPATKADDITLHISEGLIQVNRLPDEQEKAEGK